MNWELIRGLSLGMAVASATPIILYIFSRRFRRIAGPPGLEPEEPEPEYEGPRKNRSLQIGFSRLKSLGGKLIDALIAAFSLVAGFLIADQYRLHVVNAFVIGFALAGVIIYLRRGGCGGWL